VEVESATGLKAPSSAEAGLLRAKGYPENARLACHARVAESGAYIKVKQTWSMDQVRGT
jgi:ferredoxin